MTTSEATAQRLVHNYLDGRSMDAFMFAAAVWMAHKRLTGGQVPTLDQRLCDDIDSQAGSWLGKLRDFSEKLAKSKGDVRRGAADAANWIVRDYNMMISLADTAVRFPR